MIIIFPNFTNRERRKEKHRSLKQTSPRSILNKKFKICRRFTTHLNHNNNKSHTTTTSTKARLTIHDAINRASKLGRALNPKRQLSPG